MNIGQLQAHRCKRTLPMVNTVSLYHSDGMPCWVLMYCVMMYDQLALGKSGVPVLPDFVLCLIICGNM